MNGKHTMDHDTEFFSGLIELQYGLNVEDKLKKLSEKVSWARGWPEDKKAFWNAEAFMWQKKIEKDKRKLIYGELKFLENGKNLDLGCGAYSYIKSVGFDLAEKMLQFNDNCIERIKGDLEQELLFGNGEFDSVTAVFVLNYVKNYQLLLKEIYRILRDNGCFVMVLSTKEINQWQRQKEVSKFSAEFWLKKMENVGFLVKFEQNEDLWFFKGKKKS